MSHLEVFHSSTSWQLCLIWILNSVYRRECWCDRHWLWIVNCFYKHQRFFCLLRLKSWCHPRLRYQSVEWTQWLSVQFHIWNLCTRTWTILIWVGLWDLKQDFLNVGLEANAYLPQGEILISWKYSLI